MKNSFEHFYLIIKYLIRLLSTTCYILKINISLAIILLDIAV